MVHLEKNGPRKLFKIKHLQIQTGPLFSKWTGLNIAIIGFSGKSTVFMRAHKEKWEIWDKKLNPAKKSLELSKIAVTANTKFAATYH